MSQRQQLPAIGLRRAWLARCMAGVTALCAGNAAAQIPTRPSDAEVCLAANQSLSLGSALPRTMARLDGGGTVRIVAIGSSSTTGLWMASGADIILMDLQYAPLVLASSQHSIMEMIIAEVARQERVGLFPRFELMRKSIDAGLSPRALVAMGWSAQFRGRLRLRRPSTRPRDSRRRPLRR